VAQYHVKLSDGDVGKYVFLPGDPGRVSLIAGFLDDARHVVSNREFTTWTGSLDGTQVSVTSTGIGAPSTAIAVEELCNLGVHTLVRLGSAGAISADLKLGDVVIAQAAVREDGTSALYAPDNVPAVADFDVTTALREGAKAADHECRIGTVLSSDGFYPGNDPDAMPLASMLRDQLIAYQKCGVLAVDMESSTLFLVAQIRKARAGTILGVVNTVGGDPPASHALPLDATIESAIAGMRLLIQRDSGHPSVVEESKKSSISPLG
jgi:uridine phosphorylase